MAFIRKSVFFLLLLTTFSIPSHAHFYFGYSTSPHWTWLPPISSGTYGWTSYYGFWGMRSTYLYSNYPRPTVGEYRRTQKIGQALAEYKMAKMESEREASNANAIENRISVIPPSPQPFPLLGEGVKSSNPETNVPAAPEITNSQAPTIEKSDDSVQINYY